MLCDSAGPHPRDVPQLLPARVALAVHRRSPRARHLSTPGETMPTTLTVETRLAPGDRRSALEQDVREGLSHQPKAIPPVWFYDERGSVLFDEITRLPEYYPTRTERSILAAHAGDIVRTANASTLVELGSGTSEKTRLLLDAMAANDTLDRFVPFDVSEEVLQSAARDIASRYGIDVCAVVGDFHHHLDAIPRDGKPGGDPQVRATGSHDAQQ